LILKALAALRSSTRRADNSQQERFAAKLQQA
jgi:hypothetical protein